MLKDIFRRDQKDLFLKCDDNTVVRLGADWKGRGIGLNAFALLRHAFVLGSDRDDRTDILLSMFETAFRDGSGGIYVSSNDTVPARLHQIAQRHGREEDVVVLDLRKANTTPSVAFNPFEHVSPARFADIVCDTSIAYLDSDDGVRSLITPIAEALCWLRDNKGEPLNGGTVLDSVGRKDLEALSERIELPVEIRNQLSRYLAAATRGQHEYAEMRISLKVGFPFTEMPHIFASDEPGLDLAAIRADRKFLLVRIPALENGSDTTLAVVRLFGATFKAMLTDCLFGTLGSTAAYDIKPDSGKPAPFMCIFDDGPYYLPQRFPIMSGQARALGMSIIISTGDVPSAYRKDGFEQEAMSANVLTTVLLSSQNWSAELGEQITFAAAGRPGDPAWKHMSSPAHPFPSPRVFAKCMRKGEFVVMNSGRIIRGRPEEQSQEA